MVDRIRMMRKRRVKRHDECWRKREIQERMENLRRVTMMKRERVQKHDERGRER